MGNLQADVTEWTQEQCDALNASQADKTRHPYTCGNDSRHKPLVATPQGWICPDCDYRQSWAHELKSAHVLTAVQLLNAITAEYQYWRDAIADENEAVAWQATGATGACANLLAVGRGLMPPREERGVEAPGSDDVLKLLPCPFCGGKPVVRKSEWSRSHVIECKACKFAMHSEIPNRDPNEIELMWNRRVLITTPPVQAGA